MSTNNQVYSWVGVAALVLFLPVLLLQAGGEKNSLSSSVAAVASVPSRPSVPTIFSGGQTVPDVRPRQIFIPSISLNSRIVDVGTTTDGSLGVPANFNDVGWYRYGSIPGEIGSAVFDAHNDDGGLIPGPFKYLHMVNIRDIVYVTAANGTTNRFEVTDIQTYPLGQFPSDLVFYDRSGALIKIITCHGRFIPSENTYDERLIVTARLTN